MERELIQVNSKEELEDTKQLFREYSVFLNVDLCFQGFENELAQLPDKYAEPKGAIMLMKIDGLAVGCVALRPLAEDVCEMKRLFVKPEYQSLGIGRELAEAVIVQAKNKGYSSMKLDTLRRLSAANKLYKALDFVETIPYNVNPEEDVVYFEKKL